MEKLIHLSFWVTYVQCLEGYWHDNVGMKEGLKKRQIFRWGSGDDTILVLCAPT